jgi:hypothetical protein
MKYPIIYSALDKINGCHIVVIECNKTFITHLDNVNEVNGLGINPLRSVISCQR